MIEACLPYSLSRSALLWITSQRKGKVMLLGIVTIITAAAVYGAFGYAALHWGVDSRRLDGRPNW